MVPLAPQHVWPQAKRQVGRPGEWATALSVCFVLRAWRADDFIPAWTSEPLSHTEQALRGALPSDVAAKSAASFRYCGAGGGNVILVSPPWGHTHMRTRTHAHFILKLGDSQQMFFVWNEQKIFASRGEKTTQQLQFICEIKTCVLFSNKPQNLFGKSLMDSPVLKRVWPSNCFSFYKSDDNNLVCSSVFLRNSCDLQFPSELNYQHTCISDQMSI